MMTAVLGDAELADLRGVEITTHQFQRWVPKAHEARVIVVGDRVFAAGIHAGTPETIVDWRTSNRDLAYSRIEIPVHIRSGVVDYCRALSLTYGAFDFVVAPGGRWWFLACNPGGQYGWIEDAVSAPVTSALADLLVEGLQRDGARLAAPRPRARRRDCQRRWRSRAGGRCGRGTSACVRARPPSSAQRGVEGHRC